VKKVHVTLVMATAYHVGLVTLSLEQLVFPVHSLAAFHVSMETGAIAAKMENGVITVTTIVGQIVSEIRVTNRMGVASVCQDLMKQLTVRRVRQASMVHSAISYVHRATLWGVIGTEPATIAQIHMCMD